MDDTLNHERLYEERMVLRIPKSIENGVRVSECSNIEPRFVQPNEMYCLNMVIANGIPDTFASKL